MSLFLGLLKAFFFPIPMVNARGLDLIRHFEGLRLVPYKDSDGAYRIGYGCPVNDLKVPITTAEAGLLLLRTLKPFELCIHTKVKTSLNSNQFSALVSLVFNIGSGNFESSSLLKLLNEGNFPAAADEFLRWDHLGKNLSSYLLARREAERELFLTPIA